MYYYIIMLQTWLVDFIDSRISRFFRNFEAFLKNKSSSVPLEVSKVPGIDSGLKNALVSSDIITL